MYSKLTEYMNKYAGSKRRGGEAARNRRRGTGIKESKRRGRGETERVKVHAEDSILLIRSIYPDTVYPRIHVAAFTLIRSFFSPRCRDGPGPSVSCTCRDIIRDETPVACTTCFRLHISLALAPCALRLRLLFRYREWNIDGRFVEASYS